jgi:anti-sigma B factor antagonist
MTCSTREVGDVTIIDLAGRITVQDGADEFRDLARDLLGRDRVKLVLNMQQVPYIDSTALGELIRTFTSVTRHNGSVKLLNVTHHVHQLLVITSLLSVFDLFESEDDAVRSFGRPRQQEH